MDYRSVKRPDYSAIGDYLAKYRRSVKDVGYIHRKEKNEFERYQDQSRDYSTEERATMLNRSGPHREDSLY